MNLLTPTYDAFTVLLFSGILGAIGQGIRILVGLRKYYVTKLQSSATIECATCKHVFVSIFIGFIIGVLLVLLKGPQPNTTVFSTEFILMLVVTGYAGTDCIEGLFSTYFTTKNVDEVATALQETPPVIASESTMSYRNDETIAHTF